MRAQRAVDVHQQVQHGVADGSDAAGILRVVCAHECRVQVLKHVAQRLPQRGGDTDVGGRSVVV
jgi:hypothetical protein